MVTFIEFQCSMCDHTITSEDGIYEEQACFDCLEELNSEVTND